MTATSAAVTSAAVMAPSTAAVAAVAAVASTAMTAAAMAMADKFHHRRCNVLTFFVEDIEGGQANVRDFLLTEENLIAIPVA